MIIYYHHMSHVTRTFIVRNVRRRHNASNRRLNTRFCRTHPHNTSSHFECCCSTDARHGKSDKDVGAQARQAYADWPEISRGVAGIVPTARQRKMSANGLKQNLLHVTAVETVEHFLLQCPYSDLCKKIISTCSSLGVPPEIKYILSDNRMPDLIGL